MASGAGEILGIDVAVENDGLAASGSRAAQDNPVGDDGLLRFGHATALTAAQGLSFTTVSPLRYLGVPRYVIAIFKAQNPIKSTISRHFALPIVTGRRGRRPLRINLIVLLSNSDLSVSSPSVGGVRQKVTPPDFSLRPVPPNSDLSFLAKCDSKNFS